MKLSESANSTFGIASLDVTSTASIKPTEAKAHRIEFIGDSITCGYGVDHEGVGGGFTTATENATKTYAYKTAQNLDADYNFVSYSGYGIISGYTSGQKNTNQLVAPYYDKIGFSYGYFNSELEVATVPWSFEVQPEVIVINLGTNDSSYCGNDASKQAEFTEGYVDFIKMVREKNPDATIFCTLGIMGDDLYPCVKEAVEKYVAQTGDEKVTSMKFAVQAYNDGWGTDYHPTEKTHEKAARKLTSYIETVMDGRLLAISNTK
ncbi:SGNH/GDSL hydrolase family protein [Cellulosilyticum ruminicola]|uniref:SGNH/GDSL hydrolase family protein n=1 Tax=Cellulosilyticum ruminicola TaxID=425254 RepID=UPI0006D11D5A|nr:SGNH/GDSL hydrolase family protein [Cellulosilyticum ruminicola]